jgi:hypothetical protein
MTGVERSARVVGGMVAGNIEMAGAAVVGKFLVVSCGVHEKQNQVYNWVLDRNFDEEIRQKGAGQIVAGNHHVIPHHADLQMSRGGQCHDKFLNPGE